VETNHEVGRDSSRLYVPELDIRDERVALLKHNFGDQLTDEEIDVLAGENEASRMSILGVGNAWPLEALGVALIKCALLSDGDPAVGCVLKEVARRLREAKR